MYSSAESLPECIAKTRSLKSPTITPSAAAERVQRKVAVEPEPAAVKEQTTAAAAQRLLGIGHFWILLGTGYKCWMRRGTRSATLVRHARHRPNATFCSTRNPRKRPAGALGSWSSLVPQAFCGLAGEVVRGIEPHSEANSWRFGSGAGRDPHCTVETANAGLYRLVVLMGESSSGREKAKVT